MAGNAIRLVIPDTVEPPIAPGLTVLHEDQSLLVVDKPSPLPVHPCGRYNRNSLVLLARQAWPDIVLKPVHRLDANTTVDASQVLTNIVNLELLVDVGADYHRGADAPPRPTSKVP